MAVLSWAAPSTTIAASVGVQETLLTSSLNTVGFDGLGLVFPPVWKRDKGIMYTTESLLLNNIANSNVNCDEKATRLSVDQRPHEREKRPLAYPIRLCCPHGGRWGKRPAQSTSGHHWSARRAHMTPFKHMLMMSSIYYGQAMWSASRYLARHAEYRRGTVKMVDKTGILWHLMYKDVILQAVPPFIT
jgi:hypothetical protein